jgi:histidyl-tRNA synthetase
MAKQGTPKGTRDFLPKQALQRKYIFETLEDVFRQYAYMPIETPAMEHTETLMGKYGDEGDKLLFKLLPRGEKLIKSVKLIQSKIAELMSAEQKGIIEEGSVNEITSKPNPILIEALFTNEAEEALRYDLTVPFARFVTEHRNELTFPFKRYQIQPVWRADRPQKGRYREFYQCDVDVLGSDALLNEVELLLIVRDVFARLGLNDVRVRINNRKLLQGLAEAAGAADKFVPMTVALDKLDKVGWEGVVTEWRQMGFSDKNIALIKEVVSLVSGDLDAQTQLLRLEKVKQIINNPNGEKGIQELIFVLNAAAALGVSQLSIDLSLARGLNYYTGAIFEVVHPLFPSSICGGGRYDDLTGVFGWPGNSGVGISFGADRICDLLNQLDLFPNELSRSADVLLANMGESEALYSMGIMRAFQEAGLCCMLYPDKVKMKKQFAYAESLRIPYLAIAGETEMENKTITIKNLHSGEQDTCTIAAAILKLKAHE